MQHRRRRLQLAALKLRMPLAASGQPGCRRLQATPALNEVEHTYSFSKVYHTVMQTGNMKSATIQALSLLVRNEGGCLTVKWTLQPWSSSLVWVTCSLLRSLLAAADHVTGQNSRWDQTSDWTTWSLIWGVTHTEHVLILVIPIPVLVYVLLPRQQLVQCNTQSFVMIHVPLSTALQV